jgi:integrase
MDMPRPRPPYLHREKTRHGRPVWYVRRNGKRIRIKAEYGTPEYDAQYQAALSATPQPQKGAATTGTLVWLIERYREDSAWTNLAPTTRRLRKSHFEQILGTAGSKPISAITSTAIKAGIKRREKTPAQAQHFLDTMRGLFRWAIEAEKVKVDPTVTITLSRRKNDGYPIWTEEDVAAYEKRWPIGTRERVWLDVLLYTGLRRGDVVRIGRQHVRDGVATLKTEKSKYMVEVTLPILPVLAETLAAGPCGDLAFIIGAHGKPMAKQTFSNAFAAAARRAGITGKSAHGLRKLGATRAANAGATTAQLKSIFGWTSDRMPELYTRTADRRRLAMESMHKLANEKPTSIVAPSQIGATIKRKKQTKTLT